MVMVSSYAKATTLEPVLDERRCVVIQGKEGPFQPDDDMGRVLEGIMNEKAVNATFAVLHFVDKLIVAKVNENKLCFEHEAVNDLTHSHFLEARAFSASGELHAWRHEKDLRWRIRVDLEQGDARTEESTRDGIVETCLSLDEALCTWGTSCKDRFIEEKHRGFTFAVPFDITSEDLPLGYVVRHYLHHDVDGLLTVHDGRLVAFVNKTGVEIHG